MPKTGEDRELLAMVRAGAAAVPSGAAPEGLVVEAGALAPAALVRAHAA